MLCSIIKNVSKVLGVLLFYEGEIVIQLFRLVYKDCGQNFIYENKTIKIVDSLMIIVFIQY